MSSLATIAFVVCMLMVGEVVGQTNDVCLTLPRNQVDVAPKGLQGSPGKRGPVGGIGPKGVQGQKGEPGDVESCGCKPGDVIALKEQVRILSSFAAYCFDGILYNNQCIRLPYSIKSHTVNLAKAQKICSDMNSTIAEINSDAMYKEVYNYVRSRLTATEATASFAIDIWLGSTFERLNNPNNLFTLSNGSKVLLTKWYPSYPYKDSSHATYVNLIMRVNSDLGSSNKNIFNYIPSHSALPLCSYNI